MLWLTRGINVNRKKFFLAPSLMTTAGKERHVDLEWCGALQLYSS